MDKTAKEILFSTYWNSGYGWRPEDKRKTTPNDFAYAKEKGLMFDPVTISVKDALAKINAFAKSITQEEVAKAFLYSLSTRRLELRSAIASCYVAQSGVIAPVKSYYEEGEMRTYSHNASKKDIIDLNVLNFERIKWGGVRIGDVFYTMLDLDLFGHEEFGNPTKEDIEIFRNILKIVESSEENDTPSRLRDRIIASKLFKTNKAEISVIMEILACIGILKPASRNRTEPHKHDWQYCVYWRGSDKYNKSAVNKFFGKIFAEETG